MSRGQIRAGEGSAGTDAGFAEASANTESVARHPNTSRCLDTRRGCIEIHTGRKPRIVRLTETSPLS
jgi:hypothetical protein